jgi:hypothetical protein
VINKHSDKERTDPKLQGSVLVPVPKFSLFRKKKQHVKLIISPIWVVRKKSL